MYLIALCDDDVKELDQIENLLMAYQKTKNSWDYRIERFESAEELLERTQEKEYIPDFLLLDIYMKGKTGIEVAKELRNRNLKSMIVFLTTSTEHALEAYEVDAVQYLVKPLEEEKFFHAMDLATMQIQKRKESQIVIKTAGSGIRQINPDDIVYCESQKNYQVMHLLEEECRIRMTVKELWGVLEHLKQFSRCGRSYILNLNHVVSVEKEEILMNNEVKIYIPRSVAAEFKKNYFSYYFNGNLGGGNKVYQLNTYNFNFLFTLIIGEQDFFYPKNPTSYPSVWK